MCFSTLSTLGKFFYQLFEKVENCFLTIFPKFLYFLLLSSWCFYAAIYVKREKQDLCSMYERDSLTFAMATGYKNFSLIY